MKIKAISSLVALMLLASVADARWGHHGYKFHGFDHSYVGGAPFSIIPKEDRAKLSQEQIDGLIFMYQEEKLARDVYITLGKLYNARVFKNIQKSEQRHMDAVKYLLKKYNIDLPVPSDDIGAFDNEELQALYDELIEKGKESLKDALEVGVLIEETDIEDLEERIADAPSDIARVYNNLKRGSYNHLRAFRRNLERLQ